MNTFFDSALAYLLGNEGSRYTDDPADAGGPTKWGVTIASWSRYVQHEATKEMIQSLTLFQIKPFYESEYWQPMNCDRLRDAGIAIAAFDASVLFGVAAAARIVQQAANLCAGDVVVDGFIGPETITELNQLRRDVFLSALHQLLMQRIEVIIFHHPQDEKFRKGWVKRIDRLLTLDTQTVFNISF